MLATSLFAIAASLSTASAVVYKGFNYGAAADFANDFKTAQALVGTSGFTSARLYTMIAAGTTNTPTPAIQAAIDTGTTLLLGLWASETQDAFNNELAALSAAISQHGSAFTNLIAGISVGSEDLYRLTPIGAPTGSGQQPDTLVSYIGQVRSILASANISPPVGHVDTYTAWINSSNSAVTAAVDFLGMDAYPYYQNTIDNSIANANATFFSALDQTIAASTGKPVWITETGWPVSGPTDGQAVASIANAQTYWDEVGCSILGNYNTWWYTLQDAPQPTTNPSFGIQQLDCTTFFIPHQIREPGWFDVSNLPVGVHLDIRVDLIDTELVISADVFFDADLRINTVFFDPDLVIRANVVDPDLVVQPVLASYTRADQ